MFSRFFVLFLTFCLQEVDRTTSYSSTVILIFFFCFRKTGFHLGMRSFSKVVPSALNTPLVQSGQANHHQLSLLLIQQPKPSTVNYQHVAEMLKSQEHQYKQLRLLENN